MPRLRPGDRGRRVSRIAGSSVLAALLALAAPPPGASSAAEGETGLQAAAGSSAPRAGSRSPKARSPSEGGSGSAGPGGPEADEEDERGVVAPLWKAAWRALRAWWDEAGSAAGQVIGILATVLGVPLLALGLAWGGGRLRRLQRPREGVAMRLEDRTAPPSERRERSDELNDRVTHELRALDEIGGLDVEVDGLAEHTGDETGVARVATLSKALDDTPVKLGVLSVSPRQVLAVLAWLLEPPYAHSLDGTLTEASGTLSLRAVKRSRSREERREVPIVARARGEGARARVARDVAIRLVCDKGATSASWSPRSLRAYVEAEHLLAEEPAGPADTAEERKAFGYGRQARMRSALAELNRALRHDPDNWMARYRAGTVLLRLQRPREAYDQFCYVRESIESGAFRSFLHYREIRRERPDFPQMLEYHCALAAIRTGEETKVEEALERIESRLAGLGREDGGGEDVGGEEAPASKATPEEGPLEEAAELRLLALFRSARASALKARMERRRERGELEEPGPELRESVAEDLARIDADEAWIEELLRSGRADDPEVCARAHTAAQNARGRAHELCGDEEEAEEYLRRAVGVHAPEAFAEPFVHLASLLVERRAGPDEASEAERLLERALEIGPDLPEAQRLLEVVQRARTESEGAKAAARSPDEARSEPGPPPPEGPRAAVPG